MIIQYSTTIRYKNIVQNTINQVMKKLYIKIRTNPKFPNYKEVNKTTINKTSRDFVIKNKKKQLVSPIHDKLSVMN